MQNFSAPILIPPHESRYIFSLLFRPVRPSIHIDSNILLITNASKFHLPVRAYTGFLEVYNENGLLSCGVLFLTVAFQWSTEFARLGSQHMWHVTSPKVNSHGYLLTNSELNKLLQLYNLSVSVHSLYDPTRLILFRVPTDYRLDAFCKQTMLVQISAFLLTFCLWTTDVNMDYKDSLEKPTCWSVVC